MKMGEVTFDGKFVKVGSKESMAVFIDGKKAGYIMHVDGGYYYKPRGSKLTGRVYQTLRECQSSLLNEPTT
jgi:hypothetical protein